MDKKSKSSNGRVYKTYEEYISNVFPKDSETPITDYDPAQLGRKLAEQSLASLRRSIADKKS